MSLQAIIGGLLGLGMGLIGYGLASRVIEAWLIAAERDEDDPVTIRRDELERWAIGFRRMVLIGTIILFPVTGFLIGLGIGW